MKETQLGLRRQPLLTVSFFTQFTVSTLLFGIIFIFALFAESFATDATRFFEIRAYLQPSVLSSDIEQILLEIRQIPGVTHAEFTSAEEGRQWLEQRFRFSIRTLFGGNPLPPSIRVRSRNFSEMKIIAERIQNISGVQEVDFSARSEFLFRLQLVLLATRTFIVFLVLLLFVSTLFTVFNTIRLSLYVRRKEIYVMQLIGATEWFIRFPFLLEALTVGFLSALCTLSLLITLFGVLYRIHWQYLPFLPFPDFPTSIYLLGIALFAFSLFSGGMGSIISIRKFLSERVV